MSAQPNMTLSRVQRRRRWSLLAVVGALLGCASFGGSRDGAPGSATPAPDARRSTPPDEAVAKQPSPSVLGRQPLQPADRRWVMGARDPGRIYRAVDDHLTDLTSCYQQGVSVKSDLTGRVSVEFIIGPNGRVVRASVKESTLHSPPVETCIVQAVQTWEFPAPDGGGIIVVGYPFYFPPSR
jgi:TonB family protein